MGTLSFLRERTWRRGAVVVGIAAVLAAGTTGITYAATSHHRHTARVLATTSSPRIVRPTSTAPTSTAPTTTTPTTPKVQPKSTAPAKTAPAKLTEPSRTPTPRPTATPTKSLTVKLFGQDVTLPVPLGWQVSTTAMAHGCGCGGDFAPICIVAHGDYGRDPDNCELVVSGNGESQDDTDLPNPLDDLAKCSSWSTIYDADTAAAGHPADYRQFRSGCSGRVSEQWATVTTPQVSFWHPMSGGPDDVAAANAIAGAHISGTVRNGRTQDVGYVRGVTLAKSGVRITIDRVVKNLDGGVINYNPATYSYAVHVFAQDGYGTCPTTVNACTAGQLVAQFGKGTHPADGTKALDGALVQLYSFNTGGFDLEPYYSYAFHSAGDHGGCTC